MHDKKRIRELFKKSVFKRDDYTCQHCHTRYSADNADLFLDAHHIISRKDMPHGGYVKENGISLCKNTCHLKAEKFHITQGLEWEEGMHPDDLYKLINSSKEMAVKASGH